MASSFNIFRKNQKLMLAILTLLAMFAFVFLDPLFRYLGSSQAAPNPVVVETKYGNLKRTDIDSLIANRRLVDHFISGTIGMTVDKLVDQGQIDPRSRETYIKMFSDQWKRRLMQRAGATDEAQAVETMLLARRADQVGMVVSDAAVNQLIREISGDVLNQRDLAGLIARLHVGEQHLFDALRTELSAWRMTQLFSASIEGIPPAQRFDYFNRLNRKATIQAVGVPVADFVDKVKAPDDAVLKAFFEEHKDQIAMPGSAEPGFKIPRRERFQYFKAEYDIFRELAEVSDEEIQKYYDANKATMFRKLELPDEKSKSEQSPPDSSDKATDPKADVAKEPTEPAAKTNPPAKDSSAEQPQPESPKAGEAEAKPEAKPDGAASGRKVKFLLVADDKAAKDESTDDKSTDSAEPAAAPAAQNAADAKSTDESPAKPKDETDAADKPVDGSEAGKSEAEPQYEPLEKVREQIVNAIKAEKAQQKIQAAVESLSAQMRGYSDVRDVYLVEKEGNPNAKPPQDLDFVALAKQQNVAYGETKLASEFEIADSELGKSFASVRGDLPFQFRAAPFTEVAFGPKIAPYLTATTHDADGNVYLSWKVEQADERVPTFEEAREEVLKAWKLIKARDLAREQADTFAAKAKGTDRSLSEVFTGDDAQKVVTPGPFSWMTTGNTPEQGQGTVVMLSEVPGIESPGEAFMETVFSLGKGETGVAANQPKDVYYVVELVDFEPPVGELEEDFARQDFRRYVNVAMADTRQLYQAWVGSISEQANVKWLQEPVQRDRED